VDHGEEAEVYVNRMWSGVMGCELTYPQDEGRLVGQVEGDAVYDTVLDRGLGEKLRGRSGVAGGRGGGGAVGRGLAGLQRVGQRRGPEEGRGGVCKPCAVGRVSSWRTLEGMRVQTLIDSDVPIVNIKGHSS
jgi:hypothetical protein